MAQVPTVEEILAGVKGQAPAKAPEPAPAPAPIVAEVVPAPTVDAQIDAVLQQANQEKATAPAPEPAPEPELIPELQPPPKVNPPESAAADTQATIEEVPVSPGKRKKRPAKKNPPVRKASPDAVIVCTELPGSGQAEPAPEPRSFTGQIVASNMFGNTEILSEEEGIIIPVGAKVKVTIL